MFNIGAASATKLNKMEDSYTRLLTAAKELRKLRNAAEVARELDVSDQTIQNWKTRGVPDSQLVKIQEKIGALPKWIATGDGPMVAAAGTEAPDDRQRVLIEIMNRLDPKRLDAWLNIGALLSAEPNKTKIDIQKQGVAGELMKYNKISKRKLQ